MYLEQIADIIKTRDKCFVFYKVSHNVYYYKEATILQLYQTLIPN